ncbi:MAG TPA: Xaa-Pro peptidase family protein [Symbiobacteriaceae bacterium]
MKEAYFRRLEGIQTWLRQQGIAAGLVTAPVSMQYLTGWSNPSKRFAGLVIPAQGEPVLIVPTLEMGGASQGAIRILRDWRDGEDPFRLLAEVLGGAGGGPLAVEKEALPLHVFEGMAGALGAAPGKLLEQTADLSPVIAGMRERKSETELELMQRAADILNPALDAALKAIRPGITERQLAAVLEEAMAEAGAEGIAFETHVLFGPRSALPHGSTGNQPLEAGQVVLMDFGAVYQGYRSDITRTVCCGPWPEELARVYDVVLAANEAAIAAVRPGVPLGEVDRAARKVIEDAGYGPYFIHRTGHGLGLEIHEEPYVVAGNTKVLQPGHVVTIEPGIYLPGIGGVRIEDDVAVTETGYRVLTSWTKERLTV